VSTLPVTVLATQDEALVAVAESLLQGAGIKYVVTNRIFQDLVGDGKLGVNIAAGTIRIQVQPDDAELARTVLSDLEYPRSSLRMSLRTRLIYVFLLLVVPLIIGVIRLVIWAIHR
jgi:hypothetical protein